MFTPKTEVYEKLRELPYTVVQGSQAVFNELPTITFTVQNNAVNLDLGNEIASQDVIIGVDIWADTSVQASSILVEVEAKMREIFYQLTSSLDVPNTDASIHHIASSFRAVK
jgi:hypothetical protein